MIKAVHLDDRLIHGQVAISWTRYLDANLLLVINDKVVKDELRRKTLSLGVPAGVKFGFRSVEDGIKFLKDPANSKYKTMVLVNNTKDAKKILLEVQGIKRLTIGGIRKDAPMVMDSLNLNQEDIDDLNTIINNGIKVGLMPTPRHEFKDLKKVLESKGG